MANGYMPRRDLLASQWMQTFLEGLAAHPARYHVTPAEVAELALAVNAFIGALVRATTPATRTRGAVIAKDSARRFAELTVQPLYGRIKADRSISDEHKADIGVRPARVVPSHVGPPDQRPVLELAGLEPHGHVLRWSVDGIPPGSSKPPGAIGLVLVRCIAPQAVSNPEQMPYFGLFTRPKFLVPFHVHDDGQIASYAGRWITRRGQTGPWSFPLHFRVASRTPCPSARPRAA
jgi:hypothetical protein